MLDRTVLRALYIREQEALHFARRNKEAGLLTEEDVASVRRMVVASLEEHTRAAREEITESSSTREQQPPPEPAVARLGRGDPAARRPGLRTAGVQPSLRRHSAASLAALALCVASLVAWVTPWWASPLTAL